MKPKKMSANIPIYRIKTFLVFGGKRDSVRRRISGPTARDSLAQPNGLGLNVGESSGPTVRDPDQSHTYRR